MRFELTCPKDKRFSRPPRYDRFDNPPYMNCRMADFIGYSIFLEIFLEMRFCDVSEVPEKSVLTRLFCVFATDMLANFQDSLVMTASICLRVLGYSTTDIHFCQAFISKIRSKFLHLGARGAIIIKQVARLCEISRRAAYFKFLGEN